MNHSSKAVTLAATLSILGLVGLPGLAAAFPDCPADAGVDGYTCDEQTGVGKKGGYFRMTFPSDWDGDFVIVNHGFDLNDKHIRPHEVCGSDINVTCDEDADCPGSFCNDISYLGLDEILLPQGKAVAAGTFSSSGWATFTSRKDIKDILKFAKKYVKTAGLPFDKIQRVIVTGFSGGGAVTVDAMLKLKIDGAVPLCSASGGGLPTWDVAMDVRMIYDFLCDGVSGGKFLSFPDQGENNSTDSGSDSVAMALKVDKCLGVIGFHPYEPGMDDRLADFLELSGFDGGAENVATAMGFATLGLGDFVRDPKRLKSKFIGLNDTLDYTPLGSNPVLSAAFDAGVERLVEGKGRKKLSKAYNPIFTKGKGKKIEYPILAMAGAADWLVIPQFQTVFTDALDDGAKAYTQTWIDTFGHCVFSEEETTAVFNKFFEWLGPLEGPAGTQPTAADVEAECIALGGIDGDTCNFNDAFSAGVISDRIPPRADWPLAALP